jgi:anti-sigma factor RsiW
MYCSDVEILLAEYVDGTLQSEAKVAVESHLAACQGCRELAEDSASAVAFMSRAAEVEAPAELLTHILFHAPAMKPTLARRLFGRVIGGWIEPVLQPRMAMGMGVAALSFFMLRPGVRQLTPSDLDPVKVWTAAENRANRVWERGVKSYENLRMVYEIETRLSQWQEEAPAEATQVDAAQQDMQDGASKNTPENKLENDTR